mgnify:CR=1 FL=1
MLKKKRSFVTYTIIVTALLMAAGVSGLLFIQNSLMRDDMELMAYEKLTQDVRQARKYVRYDEERNPYISDDFDSREEDPDDDEYVWIFLQSNDGDILYGTLPDGYSSNPDVSGDSTVLIEAGGKEYFAVVRKGRPDKEKLNKKFSYKICALVSKKDMMQNYRELRYKSYSVIAIVAIAFAIFALVLRRMIADPVKKLNNSIEESVDNLDFTENITYDGPFRELDMLVEANNNLYNRVQQELERQTEFNANVSHELRTPVAVMHAQCQLSREIAEKNRDPEMLESIEVFERQTARMKGLIEQLLQMSVLDRDNVKIPMEEVDLKDVIESVCDDAQYICRKDIEFSYDLRSVVVTANMNHVVIVVNNLVSNAVKYSDNGGRIHVSCGEKGKSYFIEVSDNGRGMNAETKNRIFESFFRGDSDWSTEGFGLGLAQVMKIVKFYGGKIYVDSTQGEGSTFTVEIPVTDKTED